MRHGGLARICMAGVALALAVLSFTPQARAARPHSSPVTISVWTEYTKQNLDAFNYLINEFEAKYPNIKVDSVSSVNYTALQQKLQSAIFAGNPPTLAQAYESWTNDWLQSHAVQDLDPYINGKNGLSKADIKDFFAKDWADRLLGKKAYMMPFSKSDIVMYFNRAMLRRYGINAPPKTWTEFAADCKKVTVIKDGNATQWCSSLQTPESEWYAWELEWGNQVLDKHNKAAFATKQGAAPVAFFKSLAAKKETVFYQNANYQDEADFEAGKTAFYLNTSAGLYYILNGARPGVETAEAAFPAGPKHRVTELYGAPLIMFSKATSAQKDAAWLFLKFVTQPQQSAYFAMHTGYMPVRHSSLKYMTAYYKQNPQQRASVEELNSAVVEPVVAGWSKAQNDINTVLYAALMGSTSPMSAMRQAATQVNSDLNQH